VVTVDIPWIVYYESIQRELKIRCIYESRCDERLQTKTKEFTHLTHTGLVVELEHLEIETSYKLQKSGREFCARTQNVSEPIHCMGSVGTTDMTTGRRAVTTALMPAVLIAALLPVKQIQFILSLCGVSTLSARDLLSINKKST
jgi:hypothetical protein